MLRLWLLTILYGVLGIANVARGVLALTLAPIFADQSMALPLPLLGILYLAWGAGFAATLVFYWRLSRRRSRRGRKVPERARKLALGVALGYQATIWMIYLFGARASHARRLWARNLLSTAVFIVAVTLLTARSSRIENGGQG
ncbi:MAG: hypothetical protein ACP5JG_18615 [Anaerolineae bacterium]